MAHPKEILKNVTTKVSKDLLYIAQERKGPVAGSVAAGTASFFIVRHFAGASEYNTLISSLWSITPSLLGNTVVSEIKIKKGRSARSTPKSSDHLNSK